MKVKNILISALLSSSLFSLPAIAEQSQMFGDYTIHYNAMNTEILNAKVASSYKITRSKNRALLNISVLKNEMGTAVKPVKAKVTATATNLVSQLRELEVRELEDAGAIYYIAEVRIRNEETLSFKIKVQPEGSTESYDLMFNQQFFTE